ncbi:MAG TPA: class I SAM-dependent methyltransferase [Candidatus Nitrosocosmicus sp.]
MNCILCKSKDIIIIETIGRNDVIKLWLDFDVNVYDEIKTPVVNKYCCNNCGLIQYDPKNAGGDKFYSRLGEFEWYYLHEGKSEYDFIQKYINENDNLLDVGSGRGVLYTRIKKNMNYTGLELSTKAIELAQSEGINVINEDMLIHAEKNPGKYDIVCLFQVLEHLTELDKFIAAVRKCMKTGGIFCVAVPNNDGFLKDVTNNAFNMPPHHTLLWNRRSLEKLGEIFNLKPVQFYLEDLQDVHKEWYFKNYVSNKVKHIIGKNHKTVDNSFMNSKLNSILSRFGPDNTLGKSLRKNVFRKERKGHSIIAVFKKEHE